MSDSEKSLHQATETSQPTDKTSRNIKIYICTWNVNTQNPDFKLNNLIAFDLDNSPDVCIFGFQEVNSKPIQRLLDYFYNDPWTNSLTDLLVQLDYVRIKSTRLVGNLLLTFVKRPVIPFIKFCGDEWIRLGFWGLWGNKGANICAINIGLLNFTLVNSHLSAHQEQDKTRLIEHSKIVYHKFKFGESLEPLVDQDYLFLFGDLNFRTENISLEEVSEIIKNNEVEKLLNYDQLNRCIREEECFSQFKESEIAFPPTYKFKRNTDIYDLSKKNRIPSWCDRILYKFSSNDTKRDCECLAYDSISSFNQSDHKPVFGIFELKTHDWEIDEPSLYFGEITSSRDQNLEAIYFVNKSITTDSNDWIGVYYPNFKSPDDYLTYMWAERIPELENKPFKKTNKVSPTQNTSNEHFIRRKIAIEQYYLNSGFYVLGYYSNVAKTLIGISKTFELKFD